jgi:N-formylglutamate deformylase
MTGIVVLLQKSLTILTWWACRAGAPARYAVPMSTASSAPAFVLHGPAAPLTPLVLDSPHSGFAFPDDFGAALSDFDLREGEDCFVDELYRPATERGVGLIAALAPRTYIDLNRHAGDIDVALLEGGWPGELVASGKARIGKSLVWRTLDDGRPIYARKLSVGEVERRIERFHRPYHRALVARIEATHARFGASWHINCHSMNAVAGAQGEGGAGQVRADFVVGDRDGTTCDAAFTELLRSVLAGMGYDVKVNDPYKGVELVRAYSNPAARRMSVQLEINKRLYMDEATRAKNAGFAPLQRNLLTLVDAVLAYTKGELARAAR